MLDFRVLDNRELGARSRRLQREKEVSKGLLVLRRDEGNDIRTIVAATSAWLLIVHAFRVDVLGEACGQREGANDHCRVKALQARRDWLVVVGGSLRPSIASVWCMMDDCEGKSLVIVATVLV